jgi:hypothetical protein
MMIELPKHIALLVASAAVLGCASRPARTTVVVSNTGVASVDVFYSELEPYGEWVVVNQYGRVWRPSIVVVGAGFRPYGPGGHWVYTDYGWSFESDWGWGWATFHYGRWYLDPGYGWVWVPGTVWAPAWVAWRYGGGYAGWAPLPPVGSTIVIETYHPYWCFVETRYLVTPNVYHYAMPVQNYHVAFSATASVQQTMTHNGAHWNAGPPPGQVSKEIGQPIHQASLTPPPAGAPQAHRIVPGGGHPAAAPGGSPAPASNAVAHPGEAERTQGAAHSAPTSEEHAHHVAPPAEHGQVAPERGREPAANAKPPPAPPRGKGKKRR